MGNLLSILPALLILILSVVFFIVFYMVIQKMMKRDYDIKLLEMKMESNKTLFNLRLQAYERLILFLERIHPEAVMERCISEGMSARQLKYSIMLSIQGEFEHNLSQQMYVSNNAWNLIVSSKDEIIKLSEMIGNTMEFNDSAESLRNRIREGIDKSGVQIPTVTALEFLKAEARELF